MVSGVKKDKNLLALHTPSRVTVQSVHCSAPGCCHLGYMMTPHGAGSYVSLGVPSTGWCQERQKAFCDQDGRPKELQRAGHENLESADQHKSLLIPRLAVI